MIVMIYCALCLAVRLTLRLVSAGFLRLLLLSSLALSGALALIPTHHLSLSDVARLQNHLNRPFADLESAFYSVVGLTKLGATVPEQSVSKGYMIVNTRFVQPEDVVA